MSKQPFFEYEFIFAIRKLRRTTSAIQHWERRLRLFVLLPAMKIYQSNSAKATIRKYKILKGPVVSVSRTTLVSNGTQNVWSRKVVQMRCLKPLTFPTRLSHRTDNRAL